jgi:tetratricopeptide (TPR) repeat protein
VNVFSNLFDPNSYSISSLVGAGSVIILSIAIFFIVLSIKRRVNPLIRALRQFEKGRYEQSLVGVTIELERNPDNRVALLLRADAESALGRFPDAARDYYRLIHQKKPGDGIDVLEVKKKLLLPLYNEENLLELHNMCVEIQKSEPNCPEAMYYLGLLFLGQMYYDRAAEQLGALVRNRPHMHDAYFALGLAQCQGGKYDEALGAMTKAAELETSQLYHLCSAAISYLKGDFRRCLELLRVVPHREDAFENRKQYLFSIRLRAFGNYRLGRYERALHTLQVMHNLRWGVGIQSNTLYDRNGTLRTPSPKNIEQKNTVPVGIDPGDVEPETTKESALSGYYRLKEVAAEEGRLSSSLKDPLRILDLVGLSPLTESAIGLGFAMIRAGNPGAASELLKQLRNEHPELLGLGRIIQLIDEELERTENTREDKPSSLSQNSTQRVVRGGGKGYRLWEYIEAWEESAVRPYQLLIMAGLTSRKMLSPGVLLSKKS